MEKTTGRPEIGQEIPALQKTAYMPIDPNTRNVIHTDDYAREFGMRGALVGGSTLLSYVLEMVYGYFGYGWYTQGKIRVSYIGGGAINGDAVTARGLITALEPADGGTRVTLDVWMENQLQSKIVVGQASCVV